MLVCLLQNWFSCMLQRYHSFFFFFLEMMKHSNVAVLPEDPLEKCSHYLLSVFTAKFFTCRCGEITS